MTIEDDIAFLERVPALAILGREALRILAIGSENRYVHEGVSLFGEGEDADGAYVVQEGSFDLVSQQNGAAAVAREPSSVVRIPRQLFMKMLESDPNAARRMRDALAARVNQTTGEFDRVRTTLAG